jgi:predicted XRE-type DNA-binding protein
LAEGIPMPSRSPESTAKETRKKNNSVTDGSGNVFADMGVAEPEQALAKAKLAAKIAIAIEEEQLTQTKAAERLGTDQAKVSAIVLGQFSTERARLATLGGRT